MLKPIYKVIFKDKSDESDKRLQFIQKFFEICLIEPTEEGKRPVITRALQELAGKGTTTVAKKVWTSREVFGGLKNFQPSQWFDIVTGYK